MANHSARRSGLPIPDKSGKKRPLEDFFVPKELWDQVTTESFGEIRCITLKHLTPLEERAAVQRARGDALALGYELAKGSISEVSDASSDEEEDDEGQEATAEDGDLELDARPTDAAHITRYPIRDHDGTRDMLWAQMPPLVRQLVMEGYSEIAAPKSTASASFTKSRRSRG